MTGVPPSGSGSRPSGGAATASPAEPSIPNAAVEALQLVPKAIYHQWGDLELGEPEQAWACAIDRFKEEALHSRQCAEQMEKRAEDASNQARIHFERAFEFDALARAIESNPITFSASAMSAGTAETQSGSGLQPASAIPSGETPK